MEYATVGAHLAGLRAHLSARRLVVGLTKDGLKVANPAVQGRCTEVAHASDTCRRRPENGGVQWFSTSRQKPIALVDQIEDANLYVSRCPESERAT